MDEKLGQITDASLILSANRALWYEVRPNMRRVSIDYDRDKNSITLLIYYDQPLSEEECDYDVSGIILAEISADFPQEVQWKDEVIILPHPEKIPDRGLCIFQRYEC